MIVKRLLWMVLLAGLSTVAWAQDFGLDVGSSSPPFGFVTFGSVGGGGLNPFENDLGFMITTLVFDTTVQSGLGTGFFDNKCTTGGFFVHCQDYYDNTSGALQIKFWDVTTLVNDDPSDPCDPEIGEREGIPTALGCETDPRHTGHFVINLNNGDCQGECSGNWNNVTSGGADFSVNQINNQVVPEPAFFPMLGMVLLGVGGLARRQVRRR